jgi:hypothetical protein
LAVVTWTLPVDCELPFSAKNDNRQNANATMIKKQLGWALVFIETLLAKLGRQSERRADALGPACELVDDAG